MVLIILPFFIKATAHGPGPVSCRFDKEDYLTGGDYFRVVIGIGKREKRVLTAFVMPERV